MLDTALKIAKAQETLKSLYSEAAYQRLINRMLEKCENSLEKLTTVANSSYVEATVRLVAIAAMGEVTVVKPEADQTEETKTTKTSKPAKRVTTIYQARFSVKSVLDTLDALHNADKDWVHDLDGRVVRGRKCCGLVCDFLWNAQTGLVEKTATGYKLGKDVSLKAWNAYIKLAESMFDEETGKTKANFTGRQIANAI